MYGIRQVIFAQGKRRQRFGLKTTLFTLVLFLKAGYMSHQFFFIGHTCEVTLKYFKPLSSCCFIFLRLALIRCYYLYLRKFKQLFFCNFDIFLYNIGYCQDGMFCSEQDWDSHLFCLAKNLIYQQR